MITLFSIPARHEGHTAILQRNAYSSWLRLPESEVILFDENSQALDPQIREKVRLIEDLKKNEYGTPLVSEAFAISSRIANNRILAYANADIIFFDDLVTAVKSVLNYGLDSFLMVGQRTDLDVNCEIDFKPGWSEELRQQARLNGKLHGKAGIDYFVFVRDKFVELPPFPVGRPGWDSWLIYSARAAGIPVIDATSQILAVHQNHPPRYKYSDAESLENRRIAGGFSRMATIRDANLVLSARGLERPPLLERATKSFMFSGLGRQLLALKRTLQYSLLKHR